MMDFEELVKSLQEFVGVSRKNSIEKVTNTLGEVYNISGEVLLDFGDDASAIDIGNNQVILLAADGIWGQLMSVNPYWAGYCSVLVNVNDIAAMGGKPIAMVNTMSILDDEINLIRAVKTEEEKVKIEKAQRIAERAFDYILGFISTDKTEKIINSCSLAIFTISSRISLGYNAPVGLLGLMMTIPRVRELILERRSSRSGYQ